MHTTDHWINTPQGRLFARTWRPESAQKAATILLLHDSLGSVELWRDFPERIAGATGHPVVAYDRLGFGRSDHHPGVLALDFVHDEARTYVLTICDELGLGDLIPVGHSVGGGMAIVTAAHLGERCPAVITMAAQAFIEDRTLAGIRDAQRMFAEQDQVERLARYHGDKTNWVLSAWIDTWLSPAFADWNLDADLAQVHCPLLALHGDRDEYGSLRHPERIIAGTAVPSRMLVLDDCGHVPQREKPDLVIKAITRFLDDTDSRRETAKARSR